MALAPDIRKIAFLGDYLPRQYGMAAFTPDLRCAWPCEIAGATAPHPGRDIISPGERGELLHAPWDKERKTPLILGALPSMGRAATWSWTRRANPRQGPGD